MSEFRATQQLQYRTMSDNEAGTEEVNLEPFYVNVLLLNKDAIVAEQVAGKVGSGIFGRALSSVASSVVSDASVTQQVATELMEKIGAATAAMGIKTSFEQCFQQGAFVTLKARVLAIEMIELVLAAKGEEYASSFTRLLTSLTNLGLADTALPKIRTKITEMVRVKILEKFQEKIPAALQEKGIVCRVDVVTGAEQAEFFFNALQELEKGGDAGKDKDKDK